VSVALPFRPAEHDGRLLVQFGMPAGGHDDGASTPLQLVHVPPWVLQPDVNVQPAKPVKPAIVHASPLVPTRTTSPDGRFSVTQQLAFAHWVTWPPGQFASLPGPPLLLVIVKSKVMFGQSVGGADVDVVVLVELEELLELDDELLELDDVDVVWVLLDDDELLDELLDEELLDEDVLDELLEDDELDVELDVLDVDELEELVEVLLVALVLLVELDELLELDDELVDVLVVLVLDVELVEVDEVVVVVTSDTGHAVSTIGAAAERVTLNVFVPTPVGEFVSLPPAAPPKLTQ